MFPTKGGLYKPGLCRGLKGFTRSEIKSEPEQAKTHKPCWRKQSKQKQQQVSRETVATLEWKYLPQGSIYTPYKCKSVPFYAYGVTISEHQNLASKTQ